MENGERQEWRSRRHGQKAFEQHMPDWSCKGIEKYRWKIDKEEDDICECVEGEEIIEHIQCGCPVLGAKKIRHFEGEVGPALLVSQPEKCRKFLNIQLVNCNDGGMVISSRRCVVAQA